MHSCIYIYVCVRRDEKKTDKYVRKKDKKDFIKQESFARDQIKISFIIFLHVKYIIFSFFLSFFPILNSNLTKLLQSSITDI